MVSAIIPAFNEEKTIRGVIAAVRQSPIIDDNNVVDDGSTDLTGRYAEEANIRVIHIAHTEGKASAMERGVSMARNDIIFFTDADMVGLNREGIERVLRPVISGKHEMYIALNERHVFIINKVLRFSRFSAGYAHSQKIFGIACPPSIKNVSRSRSRSITTRRKQKRIWDLSLSQICIIPLKSENMDLPWGLCGEWV